MSVEKIGKDNLHAVGMLPKFRTYGTGDGLIYVLPTFCSYGAFLEVATMRKSISPLPVCNRKAAILPVLRLTKCLR